MALARRVSPKRGPKPFVERRANSLSRRREKQPWDRNRSFKILSLDGGGIRGVYSAHLLRLVEDQICDGRPIADFCDMIAGTSTGGIIAIALGLGKPASVVENLYREDGPRIFGGFWSRFPPLRLLKRMVSSVHDHSALERALYKNFGDANLGDATTRLVIPAFVGPEAQIAVFKTDHHADFKNDWKTAAWEVARATSAAPTFLEGLESEDHFFLDGGVWANNPVMCAIVDTLSCYDIAIDQIEVCSIGTGNNSTTISRFARAGGLFAWWNIIKTAMYLTTDNAHSQACLMLGPERVLRIEPSPCAAAVELDDWKKALKVMAPEAVSAFAQNEFRLREFFRAPVQPRERHYS